MKPSPYPPRPRITPGQLYRLMGADFRELRPPDCACRSPMVTPRERCSPEACNWTVEARRACACEPVVKRLVADYARRYDLLGAV